MLVEFDSFNRYEIPIVTLCNPNNNPLGYIDNFSNLEITPTFNETSKLSCTVKKYTGDKSCNSFDKIEKRRQLLVDNLGYFIITNVDEQDIDSDSTKAIEALSCEFELNYIDVPYIDGTYKFYDENNTDKSMMHIIMKVLPRWSLGHMASSIKSKSRTFEDVDTNLYDFIMNSLDKSYGCLFQFDIMNRIINIYDKNDFVVKTDILLSSDDVLKNFNKNDNIDEMYTVVRATGGNNLTVAYANPLGTEYLYNFHYYKNTNWMSQGLIDALDSWEQKISENEGIYSNLMAKLITAQAEKSEMETYIRAVKDNIAKLNKQKSAVISEGKQLDEINTAIHCEEMSLYDKTNILKDKVEALNELNKQRKTINASLSFSANFTQEQYTELTGYMSCGKYHEENIIITSIMSNAEITQQSLELYKQAKKALEKLSEPKYEFTVDSESFIFQKDFINYTNQLETGCVIDIRLSEDEIASLMLLSMPINYIDGTISFTFGNRYRMSNQSALLDDLNNRISKTSHTVENLKGRWDYPVKSHVVNEMDKFMKESLNLSKNAIVSADGQSFEAGDDGLHVRKVLPDGTLDNNELLITNATIALTDDNFKTAKTAIGSILIPDPDNSNQYIKKYGVIADCIIGNWIIGSNVSIKNESGTFSLDKNGVDLTQYSTIVELNDKLNNYYTIGQVESNFKMLNDKIAAKISKLGGANKLFGTAAYNTNDWNISGVVNTEPLDTAMKNDIIKNTSSERAFYIFDGYMSQFFNAIKGIYYSVYYKYKVINQGNSNATCTVANISTDLTSTEWTEYSNTFISPSNSVEFRVDVPSNGTLLISDIIVIEGDKIPVWQQASTEIQTDSMSFDNKGLHIGKSSDEIETNVNNREFSVKNTVNDEPLAFFNNVRAELGESLIRKSLTISNDESISKALTILPQGNGHVFVTIND